MRDDGRKRFAKEIKERVEGLRGAVRSVKGELLGKGAHILCDVLNILIRVFRRLNPHICYHQADTRHQRSARQLQSCYRMGSDFVSVLTRCAICMCFVDAFVGSMASTVFQHFVAADNASESFAGLKRIHGMMPYFMLKAALKISNPIAMIRGA